jgi:hypothetical protein
MLAVYKTLPADVLAFVRRFYGKRKATPDLREDIARRPVETLNGGCLLFCGAVVHAYSAERLAEKCRAATSRRR